VSQIHSYWREVVNASVSSTCEHNKACREIYQRITAKGKSKKLALIAVANKLLKQSLAIAKSGLYYDENYRSVNVNLG
jgi:transposase